MIKHALVFPLLLVTLVVSGQVNLSVAKKTALSFSVRSKSDSLAIPYASVAKLGSTKGAMSNVRGEVTIEVLPYDTLVIYVLGYKIESFGANKLLKQGGDSCVYLQRQSYLIDEVTVYDQHIDLHFPWDTDKNYWKNKPAAGKKSMNENVKYDEGGGIGLKIDLVKLLALLSASERAKVENRSWLKEYEKKYPLFEKASRENIADQLDLHGAELDSFMVYFNERLNLKEVATPEEVEYFVQFIWNDWVDEAASEKE